MIPLMESRLARHLDDSTREILLSRVESRRVGAGDRIFDEGSPGDGLFVVESGRVEIAARSVPGRQHRLAVMEPGEYFGEMAVFDGGARSASAIALEPSTLHFVPTNVLQLLLERSPMLAAALVRDSSLRMREFNRRFLKESLKAERLQLVERLARTIVHDFRNPLNVIGIAADLAAEESASPHTRASARDRIRNQVGVLNRMMQELLDFTRAVPPNTVLPKVGFPEFVRDILFELRPEAARRGVDLAVDGEVPDLRLRLDPHRLTRVFTNLYANAFDAMSGREDAKLLLKFRHDASWVTVELSDNGKGIPSEHQAHLFEPFFTYGKDHGTGLGLAICERIVREHGGTISVESRSGQGASFAFTLPVPAPEDTDTVRRTFQKT